MSASRRYEILLPLRFNDGQGVPDVLISDTLIELENRFGAVCWETQIIRGRWRHEEEVYSDDLMRVIIDVDDLQEHRQFFHGFKERLKSRFRQLEIYMTTHLIDVVWISTASAGTLKIRNDKVMSAAAVSESPSVVGR